MNKSQKMKKAARKARFKNIYKNIKQWYKKAVKWTKNTAKKSWAYICRKSREFWNWLKNVDIIGMINITLLVSIIVLFLSLVTNVVRSNNCVKVANNKSNVVMTQKQDNRRVVQRKHNTTLPVKMDKKTKITPKINAVGVAKPRVIRELSVPANELPKQELFGDVIIEKSPSSPILSNGVKVNGNLYIQNMNKYTIPCDAKINGHLFIRNVSRLNFCGKFKVNGNVYVNRGSSFGPIPNGTKINGQIML